MLPKPIKSIKKSLKSVGKGFKKFFTIHRSFDLYEPRIKIPEWRYPEQVPIPCLFACDIWDENIPSAADFFQGFIAVADRDAEHDEYGNFAINSLELAWHDKNADGSPLVNLGECYTLTGEGQPMPSKFQEMLACSPLGATFRRPVKLEDFGHKGYFSHAISFPATQMIIRTGWLEFTIASARKNIHLKFFTVKVANAFVEKINSLFIDVIYPVFDFHREEELAEKMPQVSNGTFWAAHMALREVMDKFRWEAWINLECQQSIMGPYCREPITAEHGSKTKRWDRKQVLRYVAYTRLIQFAAFDANKKMVVARKMVSDDHSPMGDIVRRMSKLKEQNQDEFEDNLWRVDLEERRKDRDLAVGRPELVAFDRRKAHGELRKLWQQIKPKPVLLIKFD